MTDSLWGEEFKVEEKPDVKKIIKKIKKEKEEKLLDTTKLLKSKKVSLDEKIKTISENVYRILGKQIDNVEVITDKQKLHKGKGDTLKYSLQHVS